MAKPDPKRSSPDSKGATIKNVIINNIPFKWPHLGRRIAAHIDLIP